MTLDEFKDYMEEYHAESLIVDVCNADANKEELSDMPHERREDLAAAYRIRVPVNGDQCLTAAVDNSRLEQWGISEEQLRRDAWESMEKKFPAVLLRMDDVINGVYDEDLFETEGTLHEEAETGELFVLGNHDMVHGAACLFNDGVMDRASQVLDSSLVILPSSVHETIIVRKTKDLDLDYMRSMVKQVNEAEVSPEDRLSDEIYCYDKENHNFSIIKPVQPEEDVLLDKTGTDDMHDYGYTWERMLPLTKERALELMDSGLEIYHLTSDNVESVLSKAEEIHAHDGLFGVERKAWESYLEDQGMGEDTAQTMMM